MKIYENPAFEIVIVNVKDVITLSVGDGIGASNEGEMPGESSLAL